MIKVSPPYTLGKNHQLISASESQIKAAFDPLCLLNCDKVVRVQKPKRGEVAEW
jgi:hypothetical protein